MSPNIRSRLGLAVVPLSAVLSVCASTARCQDSGDQGTMVRGDRAEISITVRDSSGAIINTPCSVKLYKNGMPSDQSSTSHGRAFFIPSGLGEFTITVEAAGYKSAQKDISLAIAGKVETGHQFCSAIWPRTKAPAFPASQSWLPRPKRRSPRRRRHCAKASWMKPKRQLDKAAKLAPSNPDVLYIQGMLYLTTEPLGQGGSGPAKSRSGRAESGSDSFGPRHGALQ